jgi:hypothetical protein
MLAFGIRKSRHSVKAVTVAIRRWCPVRHPSPKKLPGWRSATTASLSFFGDHTHLEPAVLDIKNEVREIALGADDLIFFTFQFQPIYPDEDGFRICRVFFALTHDRGSGDLRTLSFGVPQTCQECLLAGVLSFAGELPLTAPGPSRLCRCCQSRARYHNVSWQKHLPAV